MNIDDAVETVAHLVVKDWIDSNLHETREYYPEILDEYWSRVVDRVRAYADCSPPHDRDAAYALLSDPALDE